MQTSSADHRAFCARLVTHHHLPPPIVSAALPQDLHALATVFPPRPPPRAPPSDLAGIDEAYYWLAPRTGRTPRDLARLSNRQLFDITRRAVGVIAAASPSRPAGTSHRHSSPMHSSPMHSSPRHSSPRRSSHRVAGHRVASPHVASSTVASRGHSSPRVSFDGASSETKNSLLMGASGRLRRETRTEELSWQGAGGVRPPLPAGEVEELLVRYRTDPEARFTKHQMKSMRALTKAKDKAVKDAADAHRRRALAVNTALAASGALRRTRSGGRSGTGYVALPQARGAATGGIVRRRSSRGLDKK